MDVAKIPPGKDPPYDVNVVIEIPEGSQVKYEIDEQSGALFVDRFLFTPMAYPAAYGFIPGTLADDGEPTDALVLAPAPIYPGAKITGWSSCEEAYGVIAKAIAAAAAHTPTNTGSY